MAGKLDKHLTVRIKPREKAELKVACDLLEITMSKRWHKVINETIKEGRAKVSPAEFEALTKAVLDTLEAQAAKKKKTAGKKVNAKTA